MKGGEEIARMRNSRGWSRSKLVDRVRDELGADDPEYESISESWLARLETGRMVKIPRHVVEALLRALQATPSEEARLMLIADRNVLSDGNGEPDAAAEVLNYAVAMLYKKARVILNTRLGERRVAELSEAEQLELVHTALELVLKRQQRG